MADNDNKDGGGIFRVQTVPPPPGETDAYNAPTKVGPMASAIISEIVEQARRRGGVVETKSDFERAKEREREREEEEGSEPPVRPLSSKPAIAPPASSKPIISSPPSSKPHTPRATPVPGISRPQIAKIDRAVTDIAATRKVPSAKFPAFPDVTKPKAAEPIEPQRVVNLAEPEADEPVTTQVTPPVPFAVAAALDPSTLAVRAAEAQASAPTPIPPAPPLPSLNTPAPAPTPLVTPPPAPVSSGHLMAAPPAPTSSSPMMQGPLSQAPLSQPVSSHGPASFAPNLVAPHAGRPVPAAPEPSSKTRLVVLIMVLLALVAAAAALYMRK